MPRRRAPRIALLVAALSWPAPLAAQGAAEDAEVGDAALYTDTRDADAGGIDSARAWLEETDYMEEGTGGTGSEDLEVPRYGDPEPLRGSRPAPEVDAAPAAAPEEDLPRPPETPPADGPLEGEPLCDALCKRRAQRGDAESQYLLGRHYLDGWDGERKRRSAMRWMRRAAERRHPDAMYGYAWMLLSFGNPTAHTRQRAKRWLRRAAVRGHEPARLLLSQVQAIGVHTPLFLPRWHDHRP